VDRLDPFYKVVVSYIERVHVNVKENAIFWQDVPCYREILKGVLIQMKVLEPERYPDSLNQAIQ